MTRNVLIVEDNPGIGELVRMHVADLGMNAVLCDRGDTGLERFREGDIDLVVLDLMLPGMDGLSVCREIRSGPGYVPVLMLTAKSTELDRVLGLEMGADDYLTKPFSVAELSARVKALFRRVDAMSSSSGETSGPEELGELDTEGLRIDSGQAPSVRMGTGGGTDGPRVRPALALCQPPGTSLQPGSAAGQGLGIQSRRVRAYRQYPH